MRHAHSRSLITARAAAMLAVLLMSASAFARPQSYNPPPFDVFGGPGKEAQTIGHCGSIPVAQMSYTNQPRNVAIIQRKLTELGYYHGAADGVYSRITKAAVLEFQQDNGLRPDGAVGAETVQRLAFQSHPIANVRTCRSAYRTAQR